MSSKSKYYFNRLEEAQAKAEVKPEETTLSKYMFYKGIKAEVDRSKPANLTQAQAYAVSLVVADYLTEFHEDLVILKSYSRHCWQLADPTSEKGEDYFRELNKVRTSIKKVKNRIRQIETAQKVLKSISKS